MNSFQYRRRGGNRARVPEKADDLVVTHNGLTSLIGDHHGIQNLSATLSRMSPTTRRQFVEQCASATAGAMLLPVFARADSSGPSIHFPTDPRERVAVAAYPFREFIVGWKGWDRNTPSKVPRGQQMELKDFVAHVAEKFN